MRRSLCVLALAAGCTRGGGGGGVSYRGPDRWRGAYQLECGHYARYGLGWFVSYAGRNTNRATEYGHTGEWVWLQVDARYRHSLFALGPRAHAFGAGGFGGGASPRGFIGSGHAELGVTLSTRRTAFDLSLRYQPLYLEDNGAMHAVLLGFTTSWDHPP